MVALGTWRLLLGVLAVWCLALGAARAEQRIALVMGNGAYDHVGALPNPPSDAKLIAETLEALRFQTSLVLDADQTIMKQQIAAFGQKLRGAGRDAVGLFYYAGHGIQADGRNYLIPIDAQPTNEADLDLVAVDAGWILRQLESAGNSANIIILDACRNNPFPSASRAMARGLARIDAPTGSFIAYATSPGNTALDGEGLNSPFSDALARALTTEGKPIEQVFKQVRVDVIAATEGRQTPWDSSSMVQDFYFSGGPAGTEVRPVELSLWQSVSNSGDPGRLALFLQVYPNSRFAPKAQAMLAEAIANNPETLTGASAAIPTPNELAAALPARSAGASEHELIAAAQTSGRLADYQAYLEAFPQGVFVALAEAEIANLAPVAAPSTPAAPEPPQVMASIPTVMPLTWETPLTEGDSTIIGRSIHELTQGAPTFPPVAGLNPSFWQNKTCSNCHNWTRENLCNQGKFYVGNPDYLTRVVHPYGDAFKTVLVNWAEAGCQ